jgi:hypothetical protein
MRKRLCKNAIALGSVFLVFFLFEAFLCFLSMPSLTQTRPQWAVELMQKLDTTPLADLESELGGGDIVWLKTTSTVGQALFFLRKFRVTGAPVFKNDDCW